MSQQAIARCRRCGQDIVWVRSSKGNWDPFNLSGTPHYCST